MLADYAEHIDRDKTLRALNLRITFDEKGDPRAIEMQKQTRTVRR